VDVGGVLGVGWDGGVSLEFCSFWDRTLRCRCAGYVNGTCFRQGCFGRVFGLFAGILVRQQVGFARLRLVLVLVVLQFLHLWEMA